MMSSNSARVQKISRLFFCHVPKTAGITFSHILSSHFRHGEIFPHHEWDTIPITRSPNELNGYRLYQGHFQLSSIVSLLGDPLTCVTLLRNPIDRVLSAYHHVVRAKNHPRHAVIGGSQATLENFIDRIEVANYSNTHVAFLGGEALSDISVQGAHAAHRLMSTQAQHATNLSLAKERLEQMEFFGITELFDESMHLLSHTFGWEPVQEFVSHNRGSNIKPADAYSQNVIDRLYDLNQLDIELYQYSRCLFSNRYKQLVTNLLREDFSRRHESRRFEQSVDIQFGDAIIGSGWHPRENDRMGRFFRWSGPSHKSTLLIGIAPSERMMFTAAIFHVVSAATLLGLQVQINGMPLVLRFHFDEQMRATIVSAEFSGRYIHGENSINSIEFIVPETLAPNTLDHENNDSRKLGIALYWVRIGPAESFNVDVS